jgi:hypothetical protein
MPRTGRPRALDDNKQRDVCLMTTLGFTLENVARFIGCSASTIRRELRRNPAFLEKFRQAQLGCELGPLNTLRQAALTNWRAALLYLERMNPNAFVKKNVRYITQEQLQLFTEKIVTELTGNHDSKTSRRVLGKMSAFIDRIDLEAEAHRGDRRLSRSEQLERERLVDATKPIQSLAQESPSSSGALCKNYRPRRGHGV